MNTIFLGYSAFFFDIRPCDLNVESKCNSLVPDVAYITLDSPGVYIFR